MSASKGFVIQLPTGRVEIYFLPGDELGCWHVKRGARREEVGEIDGRKWFMCKECIKRYEFFPLKMPEVP